MKQLSIILFVILTFTLASCSGSAKTEQKMEETTVIHTEADLLEDFEVLVDKSLELESRITSGDEEEVTNTEYDETKKEILKFMVDNQLAIDNMSPQGKADFIAILDKTTLSAQ